MTMTYNSCVTLLASLLVVDPNDANFQIALPQIITDAELRIYRKLDLVDASIRDHSATFTAGNRNFPLPSTNGTFIVTDEVNVITPVGTSDPELGTRNQLQPCPDELLNALWPSVNGSTVPQYFAMINQDLIIVGPWPDAAYTVEVVGTSRPTPLSNANQTTPLTQFFPDLFFAASMVFGCAYQKNFGAASDDPKIALSWEAHYQELLVDAATEEARKQFTSQGWSDKSPIPQTTMPPRT